MHETSGSVTRAGVGRTARKIARPLGGGLLVALGVVLLVTPGPGIPLILVGLRLLGVGSS